MALVQTFLSYSLWNLVCIWCSRSRTPHELDSDSRLYLWPAGGVSQMPTLNASYTQTGKARVASVPFSLGCVCTSFHLSILRWLLTLQTFTMTTHEIHHAP